MKHSSRSGMKQNNRVIKRELQMQFLFLMPTGKKKDGKIRRFYRLLLPQTNSIRETETGRGVPIPIAEHMS